MALSADVINGDSGSAAEKLVLLFSSALPTQYIFFASA